MNEMANNNNLTMQQLTNLVGQTSMNVNALLGKIGDISQRVENFDNRMGKIENRMDSLETKEEITYEQQNTIDSLISQVVYNRLGIGSSSSKWTDEEREINAKYGKLFRRRLRKEVSNKGNLAYPFRTTKKGHFVDACNDIEAWIPRNGVAALKKEADANAEANRKAKEQGYLG